MGGSHLLALPRGRARRDGRHDQVVNYHHVIHALRKKPMALLNLVYRDKLFPRPADRRAFKTLSAQLPEKMACKITVKLLAVAHDRGCERELADELEKALDTGNLPDPVALRRLFGPDPADLPSISVLPVALYSRPGRGDRIAAGRDGRAGMRAQSVLQILARKYRSHR